MNTFRMSVCAGRHDFPDIIGSVFPYNVNNPADIAEINHVCDDALRGFFNTGDKLYLYVTGLTVCTVAIINWCNMHQVNLTLLHYDRETGGYVEQPVFTGFTEEDSFDFIEAVIAMMENE